MHSIRKTEMSVHLFIETLEPNANGKITLEIKLKIRLQKAHAASHKCKYRIAICFASFVERIIVGQNSINENFNLLVSFAPASAACPIASYSTAMPYLMYCCMYCTFDTIYLARTFI